jgi:HSP20 family protein
MAGKKKKVKWFWEKEPDESDQMQKLVQSFWEPFGAGFGHPRKLVDIPIDISETDKELIVRAELPGFKKDEVKLTVTETTFEIVAEKRHEKIERGETFYKKEVGHNSVHRAFSLPVAVDADRINAKLEGGILTVTMPKLGSEKKKKKIVEVE